MGKVDSSFLKLHGDFGDISFFTREGNMYYRKKSNLNKERVNNDPAFAHSRESSNEFANSSKFAKLLFDASAQISKGIRDPRAYNRLMGVANKIKDFDSISPHGSRTPMLGISHPDAKNLLINFKYNPDSCLQSALYRPFDIDDNGRLMITNLNPKNDIHPTRTATHFSFLAERIDLNLASGSYVTSWSNIYNGCLCDPPLDVCLSFDALPSTDVLQIFIVKLSFFEMRNGTLLELKGKSGSFCGIL